MKRRSLALIRLAGLLALLLAVVPAGLAQAASATSDGLVPVTLTTADSGVQNQPLAYILSATNTTAAPVTAVNLDVVFAPTAQLVPPIPEPPLCTKVGGGGGGDTLLFCAMGALAPGATTSIAFNLVPSQAGSLLVTGGDSANINGVNFASGTSLTVPIAPAPTDVQVSGSASTGSPPRGAAFTYTFQVKNGGAFPAYGVSFADTVPAGETLVAASSSIGTCTVAAGTASCGVGDLAVGAQAVITLNVIAPSAPATLTDTGSAADTNGDTQPANNSVNVTVQVR